MPPRAHEVSKVAHAVLTLALVLAACAEARPLPTVPELAPAVLPRVALVVVLGRSGSMSGPPLEEAKGAGRRSRGSSGRETSSRTASRKRRVPQGTDRATRVGASSFHVGHPAAALLRTPDALGYPIRERARFGPAQPPRPRALTSPRSVRSPPPTQPAAPPRGVSWVRARPDGVGRRRDPAREMCRPESRMSRAESGMSRPESRIDRAKRATSRAERATSRPPSAKLGTPPDEATDAPSRAADPPSDQNRPETGMGRGPRGRTRAPRGTGRAPRDAAGAAATRPRLAGWARVRRPAGHPPRAAPLVPSGR